jgi:hypothetical protein
MCDGVQPSDSRARGRDPLLERNPAHRGGRVRGQLIPQLLYADGGRARQEGLQVDRERAGSILTERAELGRFQHLPARRRRLRSGTIGSEEGGDLDPLTPRCLDGLEDRQVRVRGAP